MRVRFTAQALRDLDDLKSWLSDKNPRGYKSVATQIAEAIRPVAAHSSIGRTTLRNDIRELVEPRYGFVIPYSVQDDTVFILRIYSAKRYPLDFTTSFEPDDLS